MNIYENKYRITYEAFSKFSARISKAEDTQELAVVLQSNLKYLFNFKFFRIFIKNDSESNSINVISNSIHPVEIIECLPLDNEENLLEKNIPLHFFLDGKSTEQILGKKMEGDLWAWYFKYGKNELCVSLISSLEQPFVTRDVEIVNLLIDNFITKYQQLVLREELNHQNKNLLAALNVINSQKAQISKIVDQQKEVIDDRTKELKEKNKELAEISQLNAHTVREPLSRILGLIEISDYYSAEELKTEVLDHLKTSSEDLDKALKDVIERSAKAIELFSSKSPQ